MANNQKSFNSPAAASATDHNTAWWADEKNDIHARQNLMNSGQVDNRDAAGRTWKNGQFTCSKQVALVVIITVVLVLIAGVIAICASFAMLSLMNLQQAKLQILSNELETMRKENAGYRNETLLHVQKSSSCEKDLLKLEHRLELLTAQFELEKANITSQMETKIMFSENEKQKYKDGLEACGNEKHNLSMKLEDNGRIMEDKKKELEDKLKLCEAGKAELLKSQEALNWQLKQTENAVQPAQPVKWNGGVRIAPFQSYMTILLVAQLCYVFVRL